MSDAARRRRALACFDELAELDGPARAERLEQMCAGDAGLRAQVQALLAADASEAEPFQGDLSQWVQALGPGDGPDAAGEQVGAWRITGLLGRGGMGAVHAVERADGAYVQRAALKRVHGGQLTPAARERFLRERQVLARLQHPHIATLIDGGFDAHGDPYFVMERVDGVPVDRWCDEQTLGLRERVVLFLQVLDAVQYAHRNLVVHRDLKPSNLLVTPAGQVKLLDFGIARELEAIGQPATATADRAMTLLYASPEQLHDAPITTATDLYQLGVVLYRLLSGTHPFGIQSDTPLARQLQALSRDPEPITRSARQADAALAARRGETPASLARVLDGSLEAIVHACLRKDPAQRYASAEALANDLRAWLDNRPVAAARAGRALRVQLWLRRNRALAASVAAISLALLAGTGIALWQAREARAQARIAERESASARAALQFLTDTLAAAAPEQAMATEVSVRQLLDHAAAGLQRRGSVDPALRQPLQRMLGRLYYSLGDTQRALPLLAAGIAGVEPRRREDALALADDLVVYSDALGALEKLPEAYAAGERSGALRLRFAPDDPEQRLRAMAHLSWGHVQKYGLAWCRARAERALAFSRTLRDPPVEVMLDIYRDLGTAAEFENDFPRLLQVGREGLAFADARGVPADSPLRVAQVMSLLPALNRLGQYREAEARARGVLAAYARTGGTGGASASVMRQQLAEALDGQGRYAQALALLEQARLETLRTDNGPRNVATTRIRIARVLDHQGDAAGALAQSSQAMAALDAAGLPPGDMFRRRMARMHARALLGAGRTAEAKAALQALLAAAQQASDADDAVQVGFDLIAVARAQGDVQAGMALLPRVRAQLAGRGIPAGHARYAILLQDEAAFDALRGDRVAAERHQRQALDMFQRGENPVALAQARASLAGLLAQRGDAAQARGLLAQALPVLRDAVLPTQPGRAQAEALARRVGG